MSDPHVAPVRVLCIDDDPGTLELIKIMLSRIGIETDTAETGTLGLRMLAGGEYRLLILDLMLPDVDGFEVLKAVREDMRFDFIPVLILSARAEPEIISRGLDNGADGYITKPYLQHTLTDRVRVMLEQGRTHRQ
jgi:DNA-binding response OmpR family regulator